MLQLRLGKPINSGNYRGYQIVITNTKSSLPNLPVESVGWVENRTGSVKGRRVSTFLKTSRIEYWLSKGVDVHPSVSRVLTRSSLHSKIFRSSTVG